ncbi:unnamed protein product [Lasius platythorax]|uniref:Endonuclease/exonuclease/phosphatase domain-containing protein n=1 Tax=Lasius platythorax TaxID=488582 RepID=A0AAV2MXJ2_9HYME
MGFVRAKLGNIHFYSCYAPPSLTFDEFTDFLDRLVKDAKEHFPVAIAGDFNVWAVDWGSKETNPRGRALLEAMSCLDVVLLNSGVKPTYTRGEKSSIVDLTFVGGSLGRGNSSWRVTDVYNHSDHRLIFWEVSSDRKSTGPALKKMNTLGWRTSMFDPELFRAALDDGLIGEGSAMQKAENVMRRVVKACDVTMPRKRSTNRLPPMY